MKRVVLFRCHKLPGIVASRVLLLRSQNPGVEIYCLYGGQVENFDAFIAETGDVWDGVYCIQGRSDRWKWLHSDLAMLEWFRSQGRDADFDMLHLLEWDLLPTASLDELYESIPPGGVGLTGLTLLASVIDRWDYWTELNGSWWPDELEKLYRQCADKYGETGERMACQGPAPCFSRQFMEAYDHDPLPDLCHDEIRMPLAAQCLGFSVHDTGFFRKWFDQTEFQYFNCVEANISPDIIAEELRRPHGRRMFHPVRDIVPSIESGPVLEDDRTRLA